MQEQEKTNLLQDPIYSEMFCSGADHESLVKSGWINTGISTQERIKSIKLKTLNVDEYLVNKSISENKKPLIIFTTGSYAPMHLGHIHSLVSSFEYAQSQSMRVIKIIISPSHDIYTTNKNTSTKEYTISKRLASIKDTIETYFELYPEKRHIKNLIHIDLYESQMNEIAINFSDVLTYIKAQVKNQINETEKIIHYAYAFGQDNADFATPFEFLKDNNLHAFCVERNNPSKSNKKVNVKNNVHFIENNKYGDFSSTQIRAQKTFDNIRLNIKTSYENNTKSAQYFIRDDGSFTTLPWISQYPIQRKNIIDAYDKFIISLKSIIERHVNSNHELNDFNLEFIISDLNEQKNIIKRYIENSTNIINIDSCTNQIKGQTSINYSRLFELSGLQRSSHTFVGRKGFENSKIKNNTKYYFADDDIASGSTMKMVQDQVNEENSEIIGIINLTKIFFEEKYKKSYNCFDVVDARDFLIGAYEGGLLCKVNSEHQRLPYIFPFVNLKTRANIPYENHIAFSKEIIQLNKEFYQQCGFLKTSDLFINPEYLLFNKNSFNIKSIEDFLNAIEQSIQF